MTDLVSRETSDRESDLVTQDQPDEPAKSMASLASPKSPAKIKRQKKVRDLYCEQRLLRTESEDDFACIRAEISQDLGPTHSIEKIFVGDVVHHTWVTWRYRRVETGILNNALGAALVRILRKIQFPPSSRFYLPLDVLMAPKNTAYEWLFVPENRRRVSEMLQEFGFDESAIEAEAYRAVADDLEHVHRMLKNAEEGRDKALRSLAKYRKGIADLVRRNSDRVIAGAGTS